MNEQQLDPIIVKYIHAYNNFDIDGILFLLDGDINFQHIVNGKVGTKARGKEKFEHLARLSAGFFTSRNQEINSVSVRDNTTTVDIRYTAVLAQDMPGGLKKGETMKLQVTSHFTVKNGLITALVDES